MARQSHVPVRRCVACGNKAPQSALIRIAKTPGGRMIVDIDGKMPGRGAYLCPSKSCWGDSLKRNRLDYVLRGRVAQEDRQLLQEYAESMA